MKNKKKVKTIIISIFLIIVVCSFCLLLKFYFSTNSYIKVLKSNWDIVLPEDEENQLFHYSEPSPHGDGIRYHVIDYPNDETRQSQNIVFQIEKIFIGAKQPTEEQIEYVNQLLDQIEVDDKYIPDWNRCLLVYKKQKDNSELFLFYYSDTATLYILESFI